MCSTEKNPPSLIIVAHGTQVSVLSCIAACPDLFMLVCFRWCWQVHSIQTTSPVVPQMKLMPSDNSTAKILVLLSW